MRSFSCFATCLMVCVIFLLSKELSWHPENKVKNSFPVEIENLRFSTYKSTENIRLIKAEFDVVSGIESGGEIEIVVDGKQKVNNRLMVKVGSSHYSVDFILDHPENEDDQHLYSATAKLSIEGISADIRQQAFGINKTTLAGRTGL